MSFRVLLVAICCLLSAVIEAQRNPGGVVRLSQSALDYTAQIAVGLLSDHLKNEGSIPDASGSSGRTSYSVSNIRVRDFRPPGSTVTVNAGTGLSWSLSGADATMEGNWGYKFKLLFIKLGDSGGFTVSLSGVSLNIQISFGSNSNGQPTVSMLRCSSSIREAKARFNGSWLSWLYNLLSGIVERKIKDQMPDVICNAVRRTIEVDGNRELSSFQTNVNVFNHYNLDYSLVSPPIYGHNYIESHHKAEFRWNRDPANVPFRASPMARNYSSSMVSFYVSDYMLNSLAYAMHKNGRLFLVFTKNTLPADVRNFLNMTCTEICLGSILPDVASANPGSSGELVTNALRPPSINIQGGTVKIQFEAEMKIIVRKSDGGEIELIKIVFSGVVSGLASISNNRIVGRINSAIPTIKNVTALMPEVEENISESMLSQLNDIVRMYSDAELVPMLNQAAGIGFALPNLRGINFIRPQLRLFDGYFLVETDAAYN